MKPISQLKAILNKKYETEDGDIFEVELLDGMDAKDILDFKSRLPNNYLPKEIEELLRFSRGFEFAGLDSIRFDSFDNFGFEEAFPYSIQLAGDGFGNFWILDISSEGNWNSVYYVCHDPAVIVKQAENLSQFIMQIGAFGEQIVGSEINIVHEEVAADIWNAEIGIMELNDQDYSFEFDEIELPKMFLIADLKNKANRTGFAHGKYGADAQIIRPTDEPIWIVEKIVKQNLLSKLFTWIGKKNSKV